MDTIGLAAMETLSFNASGKSVMRHLSDLDDDDRHSVIYEIARIETIISRAAEHGPLG